MKAIIIGAGRGVRLMPTTEGEPKCFVRVGGKRILDWSIEALRAAGIDRIVFIGGYRIEKVRSSYPDLMFYHNDQWAENNIMESLMYARDEMNEPFLCTYSDILFTPTIIHKAMASESDISLVVDTHWRARYTHRSQHPTSDAEKVIVLDGLVRSVHRDIPESEAYGEFIGVAKFSKRGAQLLRESYDRAKQRYEGKPFRGAAVFGKAYLIHLLEEMIASDILIAHIDNHGGYIEVDTQEDYVYACRHWS